jgi:hypothetical protein
MILGYKLPFALIYLLFIAFLWSLFARSFSFSFGFFDSFNGTRLKTYDDIGMAGGCSMQLW